MQEAKLNSSNNRLIQLTLSDSCVFSEEFFGLLLTLDDVVAGQVSFEGLAVYLCGDLSKVDSILHQCASADELLVIKELCTNIEAIADIEHTVVDQGRVPLGVHGVGVLYPQFFSTGLDYFDTIEGEHQFQSLTESTKSSKARRTGIYLTSVAKTDNDLNFRLLRCSTNLSGSTENFQATDVHIVDALNLEANRIFEQHSPLNHVLAQVYHNACASDGKKQSKAKIKAHADKTKDMPENGVMAFCTFYSQLEKLAPLSQGNGYLNKYDLGYKSTSGLTRLVFRLKSKVNDVAGHNYVQEFSVTLYPDSVFFMPLSTNRLYTHEIKPSVLNAERLPTRLGYVVRCSCAEAVSRKGITYLKDTNTVGKSCLQELKKPTPEKMKELRQLYVEENYLDDFIDYGEHIDFSMNEGDYLPPKYQPSDDFRQYPITGSSDLFEEFQQIIEYENFGKGRRCAVLVRNNKKEASPIVRTTTRYQKPAQLFSAAHQLLAQQIQQLVSGQFAFNNALAEIYSNDYAKMGLHSDQAQDLAENSLIAVFSCYKYPDKASPPRMLVVEAKNEGADNSMKSGQTVFEIPLLHNTVTVFSLADNQKYKHKIVLDKSAQPTENEWLGITFRTSKTYIRYESDGAYFEDDSELVLATEGQQDEYFPLRSRENKECDFSYPSLNYTVSPSDLLMPVSQLKNLS